MTAPTMGGSMMGEPAAVRDPVQIAARIIRQNGGRDFVGRIRLAATTPAGFRERWAMFWCEDFGGQAKCILWSEEYTRFKEDVKDDAILLFEGVVEWREGASNGDMIVKRILSIDQARRELTRCMLLRMPYAEDEQTLRRFEGLKQALSRVPGTTPVHIAVRDKAGKVAELKLARDYWFDPNKVVVDELELILGAGNVIFTR